MKDPPTPKTIHFLFRTRLERNTSEITKETLRLSDETTPTNYEIYSFFARTNLRILKLNRKNQRDFSNRFQFLPSNVSNNSTAFISLGLLLCVLGAWFLIIS